MPDTVRLTSAQAVNRALTAARGSIVRYVLGAGGANPFKSSPAPDGYCDCSGFVAWCLGLPREDSDAWGGWIETTRVYTDATTPGGSRNLFDKVTHAEAGDVIVYPDKNGHEGHIGLITAAKNGLPTMVAHCCARSGLRSAIINEPYTVFWQGAHADRGAIFARPRFYVEEEELKHVKIIKDGVTYEGVLDDDAGKTYIEIRAMIPDAEFKWNEGKTVLNAKTKQK